MAIMRLTHAALAGMVSRGRGGVISVSSVAAFAQNPGNVSYCSTKACINSFTEGLDLELQSLRSPVKVQALCPVVETSLAGLDCGKVIVVPNWRYKIAAALMKYGSHRI